MSIVGGSLFCRNVLARWGPTTEGGGEEGRGSIHQDACTTTAHSGVGRDVKVCQPPPWLIVLPRVCPPGGGGVPLSESGRDVVLVRSMWAFALEEAGDYTRAAAVAKESLAADDTGEE